MSLKNYYKELEGMNESEALSYLQSIADEMKERVINTESDYYARGRIIYVSNDGDDNNDGLTPETAIAHIGHIVIIRQPILSVHSSSENALEMLQMIIGDDPEPEITVAAWDYTAPDYTALLLEACDLAIMPEIFAEPDEGEEPLTEEVTAAIADVHERLDMLGIPMFVDRSADEETEAAKLEWIKVYGILLGCEEAANTCYETAVAALEVQA